MREGWVDVTLGAICESTSNIKWSEYDGDSLDYIDLTSVDRDSLTITETTKVTSDNAPSRARKIIHENDVIFATTRPTLGRVTTIGREYHNQICSTGYAVLRPMAGVVITRFIYYFILSESFMKLMESLQRGASYPAVSEKDVKQSSLKIPKSLKEQQQIVAILDDAFDAIDQAQANIEKNIENAKELFQSKLNDIFSQKGEGWEEKSLGEVSTVLNGYAFKSKDTIAESNTQLLRMGNLYKNVLDLDRKPVFYPDSFAIDYDKYVLNTGDLIMSLTGTVDKTDYGYTVEVPETNIKLLLNQRIMKIDVIDECVLDKKFVRHYLQSKTFLETLYATASGTRQANLSSKTILTLVINFPKDLAKQEELVYLIEALKNFTLNLEIDYQQKLTNLEDLKKSLLEQAFAGELSYKDMPA